MVDYAYARRKTEGGRRSQAETRRAERRGRRDGNGCRSSEKSARGLRRCILNLEYRRRYHVSHDFRRGNREQAGQNTLRDPHAQRRCKRVSANPRFIAGQDGERRHLCRENPIPWKVSSRREKALQQNLSSTSLRERKLEGPLNQHRSPSRRTLPLTPLRSGQRLHRSTSKGLLICGQ